MRPRRARMVARALRVFAQPAALRGVTPMAAFAAARTIARTRPGPHTAVRLNALLHPQRLAVADASRRLDWRAFDREIDALAAGLREIGVRAGDRVAMVMANAIEHVAVHQAIARIGAVAVPIGYRLTAAEIAYILTDSAPVAAIYHERFADAVVAARDRAGVPVPARMIAVGGRGLAYRDLVRLGTRGRAPDHRDAGASGLVIYTSGTTGRPKGARRSFRDGGYEPLVDFMHQLGMSPRDRHLVVCPLYHGGAFGLFSMLTALGAASYIVDHFEAEQVLAVIARERLTCAFVVPTMLERLLALDPVALRRHDTSSLRWVASGAAPLPTETARRFQQRFGDILWNFYGATETGVVTLAGPADHVARPGTIGRALRGNAIALVDAAGHEVPTGEVGELYVRNSLLIRGYHGNPDATAAAMRGRSFSVGDLARRDADGYYYLESRRTDLIISGGVNVYPREIEDRLCEHPAVADCAVIGVADAEWGETVLALVVARAGVRLDAGELAAHCRERLAGYKCPRRIEVVPELPRNDTGKVLRRVLRERYARS